MSEHSGFMERALELARKGLYTTRPNPRVGCVIVKDSQIVGEGFHEYAGGPHAEIVALKQAGGRASDCDMYLTLEPCAHHGRTPPCCDAIISAGVRRVIIGAKDPNRQSAGGCARLQKAGVGVEFSSFSDAAEQLNPGFFSRHKRKRPWIRIKMAVSLDGKIALKNGNSRWISCAESRQDVQYWRAGSCAILSTSRTVLEDNPKLNVRIGPAEAGGRAIKQPLRVILDYGLKIPRQANLFHQPGPVLVATCSDARFATRELQRSGAEVLRLPPGSRGGVSLVHVMEELAKREINEVQVEAGGTLAGSMLSGGFFDELLLYQSPCFLGHGALAVANLPEICDMSARLNVILHKVKRTGSDLRLLFHNRDHKQ